MTLFYKTFLRKEAERIDTVIIPILEGCITYGEILEEVKANAKEAIELYIASLKDDNLPIPSGASGEDLLEYNIQII